MKVNWAYLKKPSVIIGAIVLFFILLFLLNRSGGSSSSGQTVVTTGPTDAQAAMAQQTALAQISAGLQGQALQLDYAKAQDSNQTQIALATIAAAANNQSLAVQQEIADRTVDAQTHGLDLQYQSLVASNTAQLAALKEQYDYGLASQAITANTQVQLSQDQLKAMQMQTNAGLVMALAGKNKYSSIALPAYFGAQRTATNDNSSTSFVQIGGHA